MSGGKVCQDRISELPDDLLVQILSLVSTKDAVTTMVLSKRWRFVWTMIPKLDYSETSRTEKSVWNFLDKSMQLHRSPLLESLCIQFYHEYPVNPDVGNWVAYAVKRCVRELNLRFPRAQILPTCLYSCTTLVMLTLSNNVLVDVPSQSSLPSLRTIILNRVVYKDQDSHVKLLSSCPLLKYLTVFRDGWPDNVTSFSVKVPSLERLRYSIYGGKGSLFIDSPGLNHIDISAPFGHNFSVQDMHRLDVAVLKGQIDSKQNEKFLRSFSSTMFLQLDLTRTGYYNTIKFSRLIELKICLYHGSVSYWLEALMLFLLHNTPKLKVLMIDSPCYNDLTLLWIQPSSVPDCLLSHLEVFEWRSYEGRRAESQMLAYILGNSKCLKTVGISTRITYNHEEDMEVKRELKSMYRVSPSSQLLFSTQLNWRYRK